ADVYANRREIRQVDATQRPRTDRTDRHRFALGELLFWAAVALVLAFLAAPGGEDEWYAGLAALAIVAWLQLRPRQLAAREAFRDRARYHCETCNRQFEGQGPWPSA
ncbi:MAG TPA: hypothetical protein VHG88_16080, partial [Burkholderiales bacterium]|nr:hypothetical protein [Burkholderiales bacterium]